MRTNISALKATVETSLATFWIERCWMQMKRNIAEQQIGKKDELALFLPTDSPTKLDKDELAHPVFTVTTKTSWWNFNTASNHTITSPSSRPMSPLSPRRRKLAQMKKQGSDILENVVYIVTSPIPYLVLVLLVAMVKQ